MFVVDLSSWIAFWNLLWKQEQQDQKDQERYFLDPRQLTRELHPSAGQKQRSKNEAEMALSYSE